MDHKVFYKQLLNEAAWDARIIPCEIRLHNYNVALGAYEYRLEPYGQWLNTVKFIFVGSAVHIWSDRFIDDMDGLSNPVIINLAEPDALERIAFFLSSYKMV